MPMTALLGVGIASVVIGTISDKVGRKPCVLVCLYASIFLSMAKYFLRSTFWGFCAANFVNGLFSATTPLAMAYMSDVFADKEQKQFAIGMIGAMNMVGSAGGGICAILLERQGLFTPLWLGVALLIVASIVNTLYLIEPNRKLAPAGDVHFQYDEEGDGGIEIVPLEVNEVDDEAPEILDNCVLLNIIVGAFFDNVGTSGLYPLCLSPLAFNAYYMDFKIMDQDPILSLNGYKWLSILVALTIIPAAIISPKVFGNFGMAGSCVLANILTAFVTISLMYIALSAPATSGWFGAFVAILYCGYPVTVFSQLSTGPMLDIISPVNKRGYTQGLNTSVMNFGMAVTPWVIGLVADATTTRTAIWICVAISLLAALVNAPLMFRKGMGPAPKVKYQESRPLKGEDKDLVEMALRGEYVPASVIDSINEERISKGQPLLLVHYGKYADEKRESLDVLRKNAINDFRHILKRRELFIGDLNESEDKAVAVCQKLRDIDILVNQEVLDEVDGELGSWFTDYLKENGYDAMHRSPALTKQMIMTSFPPIATEKEWKPDNVEQRLLNHERVYRKFIESEEEEDTTKAVVKLLSTQGARMY